MYKLYWSQGSGAMTPQALFEEIGAKYEKIVIDIEKEEHKSDEFLSVNPMGQIPALVLPDGTLMTETAAMLLHIVDRHPEAKLAPPAGSSERARFLRWLFFLASSVYSTNLNFFYAERYSTDPEAAEGIREAAAAELDKQFAILNDALAGRPYLLGEHFTAVDIYLWMLARWADDPERLLKTAPRVVEHADRVEQRPAIARIWPEHRED
jgi:glutathione S-transferase